MHPSFLNSRTLFLGLLSLSLAAFAQASHINLSPDEIVLKDGHALVHEAPQWGVRTLRMQLAAHQQMQPHGPKQGYFLATVISGEVQIGIGKTFDESKLKTLKAGGVFAHPADELHFARTGENPAVLQVTFVSGSATSASESPHEKHTH